MNKLFRIYFSPESDPGDNPSKGTSAPKIPLSNTQLTDNTKPEEEKIAPKTKSKK